MDATRAIAAFSGNSYAFRAVGVDPEPVATGSASIAVGSPDSTAGSIAIGGSEAPPLQWEADPVALTVADSWARYRATRHPILKWIDRIFR